MKKVFDKLIEQNIDKCIDKCIEELNKETIFMKYEIQKCVWDYYDGEGPHYAININYRTEYPKWLIQGYEFLFENTEEKRWVAGQLRFEADTNIIKTTEHFSEKEVKAMTDVISKYFIIQKLERI